MKHENFDIRSYIILISIFAKTWYKAYLIHDFIHIWSLKIFISTGCSLSSLRCVRSLFLRGRLWWDHRLILMNLRRCHSYSPSSTILIHSRYLNWFPIRWISWLHSLVTIVIIWTLISFFNAKVACQQWLFIIISCRISILSVKFRISNMNILL